MSRSVLEVEDEEHFVYFDKDGNLTTMLELTACWRQTVGNKFIVTCSEE